MKEDEIGVTPGIELNFDLLPDQARWGLFARIEESFYGRNDSREDDPATLDVDESRTRFTVIDDTDITLGTYMTVREGHQLFLEHYSDLPGHPAHGEPRVDGSAFAVGYNVALTDALELVNHVDIHVPYKDHDFAWGAMLGLLAKIVK